MLEIYKKLNVPVKYVLGNHDLVLRTYDMTAKLLGLQSSFYDFEFANYRFIVLNAFEQSRYCPEGSSERMYYERFVKEHPWLKFQPWPGLMTDKSWKKLINLLDDAKLRGQDVIVFSHVPTYGFGGNAPARIPDFKQMLGVLDKYDNIRAYISGHCHGGGLLVRNNVIHKTVKSVCDNKEPTACIFEFDSEKTSIVGIGAETDFCKYIETAGSTISGIAPCGSYVMTNCGNIAYVGADGKFSLNVPCRGMYCIKAVADGYDDVYIPYVEAPAFGIDIHMQKNTKRKLYTGKTDGYALLKIKDGDKAVRWFDIAGSAYGEYMPDRDMWCEHSENYWSDGMYAFTAENKVQIRRVPFHNELSRYGWFKGDLHAHMIHGENIYIGNIQQSAFIAKAEGYDWLYFATHLGNDGYPTDSDYMAKHLSDDKHLYRVNEEFPKSRSNHFGNCCIGPVMESVDTAKISSIELAEKFVWSEGGVTVPVHPFFGHMSFRELCLWLLCAPDKMPCIDFFYNDDFPKSMAEDYWFELLNRGYEIGCFSTSDSAFDVGRTPGSDRGATYLYMDSLSEENIKKAILNRRTMVSWDSAVLLISANGNTCGSKITADGTTYKLNVTALWQKDRCGILRIVRCGKDIQRIPVEFSDDNEMFEYSIDVSERDNSWYVAVLENDDGRIRSVTSPIWFRNSEFRHPEIIDFKMPFPKQILEMCESLTPEQLSQPQLIDVFRNMLLELNN